MTLWPSLFLGHNLQSCSVSVDCSVNGLFSLSHRQRTAKRFQPSSSSLWMRATFTSARTPSPTRLDYSRRCSTRSSAGTSDITITRDHCWSDCSHIYTGTCTHSHWWFLLAVPGFPLDSLLSTNTERQTYQGKLLFWSWVNLGEFWQKHGSNRSYITDLCSVLFFFYTSRTLKTRNVRLFYWWFTLTANIKYIVDLCMEVHLPAFTVHAYILFGQLPSDPVLYSVRVCEKHNLMK